MSVFPVNPLSGEKAVENLGTFQMQYDTDMTLDDVFEVFPLREYGMAPASSMSQQVNTRFLRVPPLDLSNGFPADIVCSLTQKDEQIGTTNYVAVSYCWDSFPAQTAGEHAYQITIDDSGRTRKPRCPHLVLRRAILYATQRKVELLWIDQECINQADQSDVEEQMQWMHLIFSQAEYVIGLLSYEILNMRQWYAFIAFQGAFIGLAEKFGILTNTWQIEYMTRLVRSFSRDRWFSRTWIYQERFSGMDKIEFLFPVSGAAREQVLKMGQNEGRVDEVMEVFSNHLGLGEDMAVRVICLIGAPIRWAKDIQAATQKKLSEATAKNLLYHLELLYNETEKTNFLRIPFKLCLDKARSGGRPSGYEGPSGGFLLAEWFKDIEKCDNRVVRDRVAIFANVADLPVRVRTTDYRSYSVALLFQLIQNDFFPAILVQVAHNERALTGFGAKDVTIKTILFEAINVFAVINGSGKHLDNDLREHISLLSPILRAAIPDERPLPEIFTGLMSGELSPEDLPWIANVVTGFKEVVVAPTTATIGQIFDGIVSAKSDASNGINHDCGRWIVVYGVRKGQLPPETKFISFFGQWRWRYEFIRKHFLP